MNTTNELLQQLNTMQTNHIKVLEERIELISQHRQHLNETISSQANQLEQAIKSITKQAIEIGEQGEKQNTNHIDAIIINKDYQIHQKVLHIESLQHTIEIDKQNTFNILVNQLKGERDFNPKMNMTDAQINDLAQDVKDSNNCE